MKHLSKFVLGLGLTGMATLGGACGGDDSGGSNPTPPAFDPSRFVAGVNNPFFPLTVGTTHVYETPDGSEHIENYVTSQTKVILGVTCMVVSAKEWLDGELIEDTLDWYAQDVDGNVWYFGEDVKNYSGGVLVSTDGSWEAGVNGAQPGIIMLANPQVGMTYAQESAPGIAEDMAEVISLNKTVNVPYGQFHNCLQTKETTPLEPGTFEYKYYATGIGLVREGSDVELISITP